MKLYLTILLCLCLTFCFGQKITFNAVGFELKPEDSAKIHRMASYEAKIFNGLYNNLINDSLNITLNLYSSRKVFKTLVKHEKHIKLRLFSIISDQALQSLVTL